ncbi:MAG: class I SAM-dependent methyltransferase [Ignavibacteria bacterium]
MNEELYKDKLIRFNSSEKYEKELDILLMLLDANSDDIILDVGCGIGTAGKFLSEHTNCQVIGYDVHKYIDANEITFYNSLQKIIKDKLIFSKIYFMHSFAHILDLEDLLIKIKLMLKHNSEIVIITPNIEFDNYYKKNRNTSHYVPDPTVVKHFNINEVRTIMELNGYQTLKVEQFGETIYETDICERIFGVFRFI